MSQVTSAQTQSRSWSQCEKAGGLHPIKERKPLVEFKQDLGTVRQIRLVITLVEKQKGRWKEEHYDNLWQK